MVKMCQCILHSWWYNWKIYHTSINQPHLSYRYMHCHLIIWIDISTSEKPIKQFYAEQTKLCIEIQKYYSFHTGNLAINTWRDIQIDAKLLTKLDTAFVNFMDKSCCSVCLKKFEILIVPPTTPAPTALI